MKYPQAVKNTTKRIQRHMPFKCMLFTKTKL